MVIKEREVRKIPRMSQVSRMQKHKADHGADPRPLPEMRGQDTQEEIKEKLHILWVREKSDL